MALNPNQIPIYAITPRTAVGILNAATAGSLGSNTNGVTIHTAGANGGRVYSLMMNTDDTAAVNVFLYLYDGSNVKPLGLVNVPLSSGNVAGANAVNALNQTSMPGLPIDNLGKPYIEMAANEVLKMACLANMTAAKKLYATAQGADY